MRFVLLYCFCFLACYSSAHNPNEANYKIYGEDGQWKLAIHFTPAAAIGILKSELPELKNQSVIKVEDYQEEIAEYFRNHIILKTGEGTPSWSFRSADLKNHDATMLFELKNLPVHFDHIFIKIDAFTELYRKPYNQVEIFAKGFYQKKVLDKNNTILTCKLSQASSANYASLSGKMGLPFALSILFAGLIWAIIKY